jgi:hypothetical protein
MTEPNDDLTPETPETPVTPETPATPQAGGKGFEAKPGAGIPNRQSRNFKQEILSRLPKLVASKWETTETLNIYQDLREVVDLDADAFLAPLEPIAEKHYD